MQKKNDSILREVRRIVKWNKTRFNRQFRRTKKSETTEKGCRYKKNGYDARTKTMA